jgi:hypothetical protein
VRDIATICLYVIFENSITYLAPCREIVFTLRTE